MNKDKYNTKICNLDNGITLITVKKESSLTSINLGVKMGSIYEEKSKKGISHFIEHMLFKGTKKRNNEELNFNLENLGGEYNAYTDYSTTVYTITALKEELNSAIDLLSDMIKNSIFDPIEIEKEREVILSEIRSSNDSIEDYSIKKIHQVAFKNSSIKDDIAGDIKTVKNITCEDLIKHYKQSYNPKNVVISITSSFAHEEVKSIIEKYFGKWQNEDKTYFNEVIQEKNTSFEKISYRKDIEQGSISYLYTFYDLNDREEMALKVLEHKLGSSTNSILFRELRENKGLCYEIFTELNTSKHVKTLYIYASVSEENIKESKKTIDKCIEDIKLEKIIFDNDTINLMVKVIKTALASTLEDTTEFGNYLLHQKLDGEDLFKFTKDIELLKTITSEDIYAVARKVLKNPTVHFLLPKEDLG